MNQKQKINWCEGRFQETRISLGYALDLVTVEESGKSGKKFERVNGRKKIDDIILKEVHEIMSNELYIHDVRDPFFDSSYDVLRNMPQRKDADAYADLVPLVAKYYSIDDGVKQTYLSRLNIPNVNLALLSRWIGGQDTPKGTLDLELALDIDLKTKYISIKKNKILDHEKAKKNKEQSISLCPEQVPLKGYKLRTQFGIGCSEQHDDLVVPDAPFGIRLYNSHDELVLHLGFWAKNDPADNKSNFILSQMQQPSQIKGPNIPGKECGAQLGIVGLEIAELVAREMGFDKISTYSAEKHPMFMQYPDRKPQFKGGFTEYYDSSAKALGYKGSRSTFYVKNLK
ncbi:MAG TPA: hypothetical protein VEC16_04610 [Alphaproteobacteria bacterium]|nr:hypothetical protein [Alphaproteobacteria bacterium]